MLAEGSTGYEHMVTMARSKSPWGTFEPFNSNPLLSHRSLPCNIRATGHADLINCGEYWFAVFLGIRTFGYYDTHNIGRETFLCPVIWADDGFPVFGNNGTVSEEMEIPIQPQPFQDKIQERNDFDSEKFEYC